MRRDPSRFRREPHRFPARWLRRPWPWIGLCVLFALIASPVAAQEEGGGDCSCLLLEGSDGFTVPASLLSTEVELRVTGVLVRARVTQRFVNPDQVWLEGRYTLPLPEGAAVDGLHMVIGEREIEGQIREKEEAERIYREARREGRKASVVHQKRPNLFSTAVANVGPGEEVEITIEYQEVLRYDGAVFRLRFPLTLTQRYEPILPRVALVEEAQPLLSSVAGGLGQLRPRLASWNDESLDDVLPAVAAPPPDLRLTVDLDLAYPLAGIESSYHPVEISRFGDGLRVTLGDEPLPADRDFELVWTPETGAEPGASLYAEEVGGDVYALLVLLPPDPDAPGFSRLPRETLFVIDTSGSMGGASIVQARSALLYALDRLGPLDAFNVIEFNSITRRLFPVSRAVSDESLEMARRWVGGLDAEGGTEMLPALLAALDGEEGNVGGVKQVIFITDGAVGREDALFGVIEDHLGQARLFTVGIGSAPNSHFMRAAAAAGRGTYTFIGSPDEVEERMGDLFYKLETPTLTQVEVAWDDPDAEVWPARLPDLYAGEPLVLAARLGELGNEVRVTGWRDGAFWQQSLGVRGALERTSGIGKLWARRKIDALLEARRRLPAAHPAGVPHPEREELRRQVVEVALAHHLVSPFTSLVAVDVTPRRPGSEPLHARRVANATPAGSLPGQLPAGGTALRLEVLLGLALLAAGALLGRRRMRAGWVRR